MAFSMHSHSGQFCPGHAKDDLEVVLKTAIAKAPLYPLHIKFLAEAQRLRTAYPSIKILIGFEGEWIRPSYGPLIRSFAADPAVDYFIGSVHHVHEIPIDYDAKYYADAIAASSPPTEAQLYCDYYDAQHAMLLDLKPRVVGHFDLIRLLSSSPDRTDLKTWDEARVWLRIVRNLQLVVEQGGLLEINTSALRKGLSEPYPAGAICEEFLRMGGRLTLSDDSHGVEHVGTNYERAVGYLEGMGVERVWTLERREDGGVKTMGVVGVKVEEIKRSLK